MVTTSFVGLASDMDQPGAPGTRFERVAFDDLPGWPHDDHVAALAVFRAGCNSPASLRAGRAPPPALCGICAVALGLGALDRAAARAFFERHFQPFRIVPADGTTGFMTGYFEPEFRGALVPGAGYSTPLFGRPDDLVTWAADAAPADRPPGFDAARRTSTGALEPYLSRAEIESAHEKGRFFAPIIAWLPDAVDRFIMQVQGSARLVLPDGRHVRLAYAGRNGHPYVSLGRELSRLEGIPPAQLTMDRLVARLRADPDWAAAFMRRNPSFVFFRVADELPPDAGPIGGAGLPLTAHRSLAADRTVWPYGLPMWLDGTIPEALPDRTIPEAPDRPLQRLMIVQDTGSAIVGPARFDYFHGSGAAAGYAAGLTRHTVAATVLWPRDLATVP